MKQQASIDASTLHGNGFDADSKHPFQGEYSPKPQSQGYYPNGLEQSDNEIEDFKPDASDTSVYQSILPPRMGKRLSGS